MIRATVDTSVLAPSVRRAHESELALAPVLRAWHDRQFEFVTSDEMLDELRTTLSKPYFSRYLTPQDQRASLSLFRRFATIVPITVAVEGVATHPEDDVILATALSGRVDYLVTLDRQLLTLESYGGVRIVTPQAFLAIFSAED